MARSVTQYDLTFATAHPLTNQQATNLLEVADSLDMLERSPFGAYRYRFVATTNASPDEFIALVHTLIAPNEFGVERCVADTPPHR